MTRNVVRPLRFDATRKAAKRKRDRASKERREEREFGLQRRLNRMVRPANDVRSICGEHDNDNSASS